MKNHKTKPWTRLRPTTSALFPARLLSAIAALGIAVTSAHAQNAEKAIADFEGTNYGTWTVTGTAFGNAPANGSLPNQMKVEAFRGKGLANSFHGGDDAVGTLTSPAFRIEHNYLQFLIGGGGWAEKTCMNLLVNGKIVRTATGPNTQPGGNENLDQQQWDVSEFLNKSAVIQIVDNATGGWGHINVDHIVQSDQKIPGLTILKNVTRTFQVEKPYLNLPVKNGAPKRVIKVLVNGKVERDFTIELAPEAPDFWSFMDLTPFTGKEIAVSVDTLPDNSKGLESMTQTDHPAGQENLYNEPLRPQFHFSSQVGWLNDPNGLVFYEGEYHLFYQHNPYGWGWGNMHWGHAVSTDLVHWKELPIALYPDDHGTMFSGSAVVDWNNTTGFQTGQEKVLVAMFTAAGKPFTQGLAYSNDRGRTWTKYEKNPVLNHIEAENRDPKMIWYAPDNKWVMALYLDRNDYALFSSPNLKQWEKLCDVRIPNEGECPDFFPMAIDGNTNDMRWIFYGANGRYLVGSFDGKTFKPEGEAQSLQNGNIWYASQTYSDIPATDGRRILIPWARGSDFPNSAFNQMMGLPVELTLTRSDEGPRLRANPVKELETLRVKSHTLKPQTLHPATNPLEGINPELCDIVVEFTPGTATEVAFDLHGVSVKYDATRQELSSRDKKSKINGTNGTVQLRMLVDRTSIDIYGDTGRLYMPMGVNFPKNDRSLSIDSKGGTVGINSLVVHELKSAWK